MPFKLLWAWSSAIAFLLMGSLALAADTAQPSSPAPASTAANSQSGSQAVINNNQRSTSEAPRQFNSAVPGVLSGPGPFPGFPIQNGHWQLYRPAIWQTISVQEIDRMSRKFHLSDALPFNWKTRVRIDVINPELVSPNHKPIALLDWWPELTCYRHDKEVARITVISDYLHPDEEALGLALKEAEKLGVPRVAIRYRELHEGVTKGLSIGSGGAASRITEPGTDNDVVGLAVGGVLGRNRTKVEDHRLYDIICLNDGPIEPPQLPERPQAKVPREPAQTPGPPPPPQKIEVVVHVEPIQVQLPPIRFAEPPPQPLLQIPSPASASMETCAGLPKLTILFDLNKHDVKSEYLPKIRGYVAWLETHPGCRVQVEGHTCISGTFDYDEAEGGKRAEAVYRLFIASGGRTDQIVQFASLGKSRPISRIPTAAEQAQNRRVILRLIGPASGR